jgi:hypothetical protein
MRDMVSVGGPDLRGEVLLALHNGNISPDFADLAYLYLLRLLTFPDLVRKFGKDYPTNPVLSITVSDEIVNLPTDLFW